MTDLFGLFRCTCQNYERLHNYLKSNDGSLFAWKVQIFTHPQSLIKYQFKTIQNLTKSIPYFTNRLCSARSNDMNDRPVENSILRKLQENFRPVHLEVKNESYMHSVPKGSETHFKVVVISTAFESQPLIKRHRSINEVLEDELKCGVHALSIVAKTPSQWEQSGQTVSKSPPCMGGAGL